MTVAFTNTDEVKTIRAIVSDTVHRIMNRLPSGSSFTKDHLKAAAQAQFNTYIPGKTLPVSSASA